MPLQARLDGLQKSTAVRQAYKTLIDAHKLIYDSQWLATAETLTTLRKTPRKLKAALTQLIGFYNQPLTSGTLDSAFNAFLKTWNAQFKPKKRRV